MAITHDHPAFSSDVEQRGQGGFEVRQVDLAAPLLWLQKGWEDFLRIPGLSLLYGLLSVAGCYLMYLWARDSLALMLGLFSGVLLAGPFMAVGLYAAAREMETGGKATIFGSLQTIASVAFRVSLIGVFLVFVYLAWLRVSSIIVALHYAAFQPDAMQLALTSFDWGTISVLLLYLGIGFFFAALVFVTMAVALPLILDRRTDPVTAVVTSVRAVNANRVTMLYWAFLITAATVVSLATAFLGFAVLFPLLGYATWHSYRDLVA